MVTHPLLKSIVGTLGLYLWYCLMVSLVPLGLYVYRGVWPSDLVTSHMMSLSEIRRILKERGAPYVIHKKGLVEKSDFASLLDETGKISLEECKWFRKSKKTKPSLMLDVTIEHDLHLHSTFNLQDTRNEAWIINLQKTTRSQTLSVLDQHDWQKLKERLAQYGNINTAMVYCDPERTKCTGITKPEIWFAGMHPHDLNTVKKSYSGPPAVDDVISWVSDNMASLGSVTTVRSLKKLQHFMRQNSYSTSPTAMPMVFLLTHSSHIPLYFSALSLKYNGMVKFMVVRLKLPVGQKLLDELNNNHTRLLISTAGKNVSFGEGLGQFQSFHSLDTYIRIRVHQEFQDVLNFILFVVLIIGSQVIIFHNSDSGISKIFYIYLLFSIITMCFYLFLLIIYDEKFTEEKSHRFGIKPYFTTLKHVFLVVGSFTIPEWLVSFTWLESSYFLIKILFVYYFVEILLLTHFWSNSKSSAKEKLL